MNKSIISKEASFNDQEKSIVAWASTEEIDRDGEILKADGWNLENFRRNPVLLAYHDIRKLPVGKVLWIKPDPKQEPYGLKFKAQFAETAEGNDAWYLYKNGFMNAFSVGFKPLEQPYQIIINDRKVNVYPKNELLEISCVPVPANASAVVDMKMLKSETFKDMLFLTKPGWDETENMFRYRLRNPDQFIEDSFRTIIITTNPKIVKAVAGKLKSDNSAMILQSLMFPKSQWTLQEAKSWMSEHKDIVKGDEQMSVKGVIAYHNYGNADERESWDAGAVIRECNVDTLKKICAWYDSENPDLKTSYKLPHHRKDLKCVWKAVANAMARLSQTDIPDDDKEGVYNHLARHYDDFGKEPPEFEKANSFDQYESIEYYINTLIEPISAKSFDPDLIGITTSSFDGGDISEILVDLDDDDIEIEI